MGVYYSILIRDPQIVWVILKASIIPPKLLSPATPNGPSLDFYTRHEIQA